MDSRQLYKAAEHLGSTLTWDKDWIHFGTGMDVNYKLVEDLISVFLQGHHINLVHQRTNSGRVGAIDILPMIIELLGKDSFELWNDSMERAIQFDRIGVLLKGRKDGLQQAI